MYTYHYKILSHMGGRTENQDFARCIKFSEQGFACALADGLGGYNGGREASHLAVNTIVNLIQQDLHFSKDGLLTLQQEAHKAIVIEQQQPNLGNMRSTLVLLVLWQRQALWLHCGDSRLYHMRDGQIIAQTRDHSVPSLFVAAEEITFDEIRTHPDRNKVLRSLGGEGNEYKATVSKHAIDVEENDLFLLCSDGFWEYVLEHEMLALWNGDLNAWLQAMQVLILERAEADHDNYTACAIQVHKNS